MHFPKFPSGQVICNAIKFWTRMIRVHLASFLFRSGFALLKISHLDLGNYDKNQTCNFYKNLKSDALNVLSRVKLNNR